MNKPNQSSSSSLHHNHVTITPKECTHTHAHPSNAPILAAAAAPRCDERATGPSPLQRPTRMDVSPRLLLITRAGRARARRSPRCCRSCRPCHRGPGPRRARGPPRRSSGSAGGRFASASRSPSSVPPDELHTPHTHTEFSRQRWRHLA